MENKLKPCPFCGGKAKARENFIGQWYVSCNDCNTIVWTESDDYKSKNEAIKAWSRRVEDDKDRA